MFRLSIFLIALLPKPRRSHRYACVWEAALSNFWAHLWLVYQIKEEDKCVKIEYIIDDRQNYGFFLR